MTKQEGRGVLSVLKLAEAFAQHMPREEVRAYIDGLGDAEFVEVLRALSAAEPDGNLFYESAALRIEQLSPKSASDECGATWSGHLCVRPAGHDGVCSQFLMDGDREGHQ